MRVRDLLVVRMMMMVLLMRMRVVVVRMVLVLRLGRGRRLLLVHLRVRMERGGRSLPVRTAWLVLLRMALVLLLRRRRRVCRHGRLGGHHCGRVTLWLWLWLWFKTALRKGGWVGRLLLCPLLLLLRLLLFCLLMFELLELLFESRDGNRYDGRHQVHRVCQTRAP